MNRKNVIAVISPKGGVGKTVTTANIACALAVNHNLKVLAIDSNTSTASLGLHLDIFYPKKTINDLKKKKGSLKKVLHHYHENLHVVPAAIEVRKEEKNLKKMRENLNANTKFYNKFLDEASKNYDLVLIDCAPGFDLEAISAMSSSGGFILVVNPEYPSLVTAVKAAEYANTLKIPVGGIVLNKISGKKYEMKEKEIEELLGIKIIGKVPHDKRVKESIDLRTPVVLSKPRSKSAKAYNKIAMAVMGLEKKAGVLKRVLGRFKRKEKS